MFPVYKMNHLFTESIIKEQNINYQNSGSLGAGSPQDSWVFLYSHQGFAQVITDCWVFVAVAVLTLEDIVYFSGIKLT